MTDRRFEDAIITVKHAKNAAQGHGLVHHLGEGHVYGFTSALSVLVPLPGELISAGGGGFLFLRLASLVAFVVAAVYARRLARLLGMGPWPTGLVLAYLAFDQLQIFYGMAGMETEMAVAVLLASIYYVWQGPWLAAGLTLGLALLARPDFVLWVLPAMVVLLFRNVRDAIRAAAVGAAVFAPWLIFTTLYYGSPIPNTIRAKSLSLAPFQPSSLDPVAWWHFTGDQLTYNKFDWKLVSPFLERTFTTETPLPYELLKLVALAVLALALLGAVSSWRFGPWRAATVYVALFVVYKFYFLPNYYFEWYYPPVLALLFFLCALGIQRLAAPIPRLAAAAAASVAILFALHMPFSFPLEATIQKRIEDRVRAPLGAYLGRVVKPGESITSESSGYVGWDTNALFYDFPGLTSKTVYNVLRETNGTYTNVCGVVYLLHPDWVVLRPFELAFCRSINPRTLAHYRFDRRFRVSEASSSLEHWGLAFDDIDRDFILLRRR
jgi:hypothetical protein